MISVMIVDDEKRTREGLIKHFSWEKYDAKVVAQAEDGKAALSFIEKFEPDLILCDVKMPKMDGITFANCLYERGYKSKIIFISGYDNISYIRSAFKLNAVDYILKPVNFSDLSDVLERITNQIKMEKCAEEQHEIEQNVTRTLIIKKLLAEAPGAVQNNRKELHYLKIGGCTKYMLVVLRLKNFFDKYVREDEVKALRFAVQNIMTELIKREYSGYVINAQDNDVLIGVLGFKENQELAGEQELRDWAELVENMLEIDADINFGEIIDGFSCFREQYFNLCLKFDNNEMHIVNGIKDYIDIHYSEKLTINDIAASVFIAPTYACGLFKKITGITINGYITDVRMKKAMELMKSRRLKLYEISEMVGYSDPNYFNKLIKKYYGKSFKEIDKNFDGGN